MTTTEGGWAFAERIARPAVMAIALAFTLTNIWFLAMDPEFAQDVTAYWDAAMRLREGQELYPAFPDAGAAEVYRYAPWFAWAWIPLTFLPRALVDVAWVVVLMAFAFAAILPAVRTRTEEGIVLALLMWPLLATLSIWGNVHALMVCMLVFGIGTRWGPLAIAAAASLKAVPIVLALVFLGRREWGKFVLTIGLTLALVAPMLYYGVENYTTDPAGAALFSGWSWWIVLLLGSIATLLLARSRAGWLAGAATATVIFPRFFLYDASVILAGYPAATDRSGEPSVSIPGPLIGRIGDV